MKGDATPERPALPEGEHPPVLTGYRVDRLLGTGGHGRVWLVYDDDGGIPCALKVGAGSNLSPHAGFAGVERELQILQRYRHEHLLRVYALVPTDRGPGMVVEYAAGGSLLGLVAARGPLTVGECVTILAPMAQVLAYLHAAGAAHGDVSPGNILFTAEGKPLLADLGTARVLGEAEDPEPGTPGFSAPAGKRAVQPGSLETAGDVYSLCAAGWFALTGRVPGPAAQRPPLSLLVPDVPETLLELLEAGLQEVPDRRPAAREYAQLVLKTASPEPLDLVPAVHVSVLPELRTRRASDAVPPPGARRLRGLRQPARSWAQGLLRPGSVRPARPARPLRPAGRPALVRGRLGMLTAGARAFAGIAVAVTAAPLPAGVVAAPAAPSPPARAATPAVPAPPAPAAPPPPALPVSLGLLRPAQAALLTKGGHRDALPVLARLRADAFRTGNSDLLRHVNAAGSSAMAADRAALARLIERGHVLAGLSIRLEQVRTVRAPAGLEGTRVKACAAAAVFSGYEVQNRSGAVLRRERAPQAQHLVFVLAHRDGAWKLLSVHPLPSAG